MQPDFLSKAVVGSFVDLGSHMAFYVTPQQPIRKLGREIAATAKSKSHREHFVHSGTHTDCI